MTQNLSTREFEVFLLVCGGISNKQVAEKIFTTEKTVKFHLTNIYKKLECKSRAEMTARYYKLELPQDLLNRIHGVQTKTGGFLEKPSDKSVEQKPGVPEVEGETGLPRGTLG